MEDHAEDKWLSRQELAERYGLPVKTPAEWAPKGTGPRYAKFGRHVRYHLSDVIDWERGSKPATYGLSVPSAVDAGGGLQTRTGTRR
jgi:hypothetical protein